MNDKTLKLALPWYRHPWPWLLMLGPFVVVVAGLLKVSFLHSTKDAVQYGPFAGIVLVEGRSLDPHRRGDLLHRNGRIAIFGKKAQGFRLDPLLGIG